MFAKFTMSIAQKILNANLFSSNKFVKYENEHYVYTLFLICQIHLFGSMVYVSHVLFYIFSKYIVEDTLSLHDIVSLNQFTA